ncbi:acyltransferase family protein [Agrobacterium sp. Azo12]|uniref:acyltransferase family protein n=1 Tax=Agrobacterium sp. Azo12 TaxID=3031129 RepID=UPI0023D87552|nr:acyltransferase family protein [Agrobacterium sp. Azo12]MDO5895132.1 acyltransferase family protein [Agrobacterium sp. Azo12]
MQIMKYRADIDGLRAVAVSSVVLYHSFPSVLPGGFSGVDIFFVISGFLISSTIFAAIDNREFSLLDFYIRRVRRIFPALFVVLLFAMAVGWALLSPSDYERLGRHVGAGAIFISNYALWSESGYFDASGQLKPLLHLWSLAIEEQFYLLFPLLVIVLSKLKFNRLSVVGTIALLSFSLNIIHYQDEPARAFYSPQTRIWEILIGSILAHATLTKPLYMNDGVRSGLSIVGVALIAFAMVSLSSSAPFPGWWALAPTLGTALVISAGPNAQLNRQVLSNPVLVWIGKISFPLYLWHWPLLAYARIYFSDEPPAIWRASAVVISVILAWLTLLYIEAPLRFGRFKTWKASGLAVSILLLGGIGLASPPIKVKIEVSNEKALFDAHFENAPPTLNYVVKSGVYAQYRNDCNFYDMEQYRAGRPTNIPVSSISPSCTDPGNKEKSLFLWGDSHVQQLYFGLTKTMPNEWNTLIVASSGCSPDTRSVHDSNSDYCARSNWFAMKSIHTLKPAVVVVAQQKDHDVAAMQRMSSDLQNAGAQAVIFTGPVPAWSAPLYKLMLDKWWDATPQRTYDGVKSEALEADNILKNQFPQMTSSRYVSLISALCNANGCLTYLGDDRMRGITAWDTSHLTLASSQYIAEQVLTPAILDTFTSSKK